MTSTVVEKATGKGKTVETVKRSAVSVVRGGGKRANKKHTGILGSEIHCMFI